MWQGKYASSEGPRRLERGEGARKLTQTIETLPSLGGKISARKSVPYPVDSSAHPMAILAMGLGSLPTWLCLLHSALTKGVSMRMKTGLMAWIHSTGIPNRLTSWEQ